jgi:lysozyme family protein
MTTFFKNRVIPFLWNWEGTTYENDPDDPGGATKYGIDQASHKSVDIKNLTEEQAEQIYWNDWIKYGCDHIPYPLNWCFFDTAENQGLERAQLWLKNCGGSPKKYLDFRIDKYKSIASHNPPLAKFLKGWIARVNDLSKEIGIA